MFTQLFIMSTATLKPRPVLPTSFDEAEALYKKAGKVLGKPKKRTVTKTKTMTEQTTTPQTYNKVQSHLPDVQLIGREVLWEDFKNRLRINNYECKAAMEDLKKVVTETHKLASPYVNKAVDKVKALRS